MPSMRRRIGQASGLWRLEVAARMVSAEPVVVGGPQVKTRSRSSFCTSISEEFFTVRAQMGLTIAG